MTTTMQPDPLAEALALLGDAAARPELVAAVERFHASEAMRHAGPRLAARLEAIAAAAALLADAAGDPDMLDWLCPVHGHLPTSDPEALAAAGGIELEAGLLEDFAVLARLAHQRLEAASAGPSARWVLLMQLAQIWTSRGHHLGSGNGGRFHQFAQLVGDTADCEITHHSIRQIVRKWAEKDASSHTARPAIAA